MKVKYCVAPCPFCGSVPTVAYRDSPGSRRTVVQCVNDACRVNPMLIESTAKRAADAWNTRTTNTKPEWVELHR